MGLCLLGAVGNVPMRWYKDEDHIGYDREANKIIRAQRKVRSTARPCAVRGLSGIMSRRQLMVAGAMIEYTISLPWLLLRRFWRIIAQPRGLYHQGGCC